MESLLKLGVAQKQQLVTHLSFDLCARIVALVPECDNGQRLRLIIAKSPRQ